MDITRCLFVLASVTTALACDRGDTQPAPAAAGERAAPPPVAADDGAVDRAKPSAEEAKPVAAEPDPVVEPAGGDPAPAVVSKPGPGPLRFEPVSGPGGPLPYAARSDESEDSSAGWDFGWTKDGKHFASCTYDASDEGGECTVQTTSGKVTERFAPGEWATYDKKHGPIERGATTWDHADIVLTFARKGPELKIGGRVATEPDGGEPALFEASFDPSWYFEEEGDVGIGYVSVAPDGEHMAIAAAAMLGEIDQTLKIRVFETDELAARVYSAHGFQKREAGAHEAAAELFARAAAASDAWKHPYNEACARAAGKLDGVEAALETAIARGGAQVKAKAGRDPDLDGVRGEAWFATLVGK